MSNTSNQLEQGCSFADGCQEVDLVIDPRATDLGNFSVRRTLPNLRKRAIGPWVFFDHMGPASFAAGNGIDVRPHPHIGIATVTYLFEGEILHRDSLGFEQPIRPGDVNLMVSGRGIVHSERERDVVRGVPHKLHGLQLWLALPAADEEIEPAFHHYPEQDIPSLTIDGVPVRVIMGQAYGRQSPVKTFAQTLYVEAHMQAGQKLILAPAAERGIYVAQGALKIGNTVVTEHQMAVLTTREDIQIEATQTSRMALIGGEPMGDRRMQWNFVSSRPERVEQAKRDWKEGRFPKVPGDEFEFIPMPGS